MIHLLSKTLGYFICISLTTCFFFVFCFFLFFCLLICFSIVPHLLTRNDIRNIWPFIGAELDSGESKRVGKELDLTGFQELLVRIALVNGLTPDGRPKALCLDKQPHSAIGALVKWLHLDDRSAVKQKLATVGKKTQKRLSNASQENSMGNPFTKSDNRRFKLLESLHPKSTTVSEMIDEGNRKLKAVKKRGRRGGNVNLTQGLSVLTKVMKKYHHSLKHTFAAFESELVTTSWKRFNRDRSSGQICRTYIDAGDCVVNHEYQFTLRIKNQTNFTLNLIGLEYRSKMNREEREENDDNNDDNNNNNNDNNNNDDNNNDDNNALPHPVNIKIDATHKHHEDKDTKLVLHPHATQRVNIIVQATRECEIFEMLQFQAIKEPTSSNGSGRRGTTFFQSKDTLTQNLLNKPSLINKSTPTGAPPLETPSDKQVHQHLENISRPNSSSRNSTSRSSNKQESSKRSKNDKYFTVHCPFYLRCPTPRNFYVKPSRIQQTLHQRMSLPSLAFDDNGEMEVTYDGFDEDMGPFNKSLYDEPGIGSRPNSSGSNGSNRSNRSNRSSNGTRVSMAGFMGDTKEAKAARERAREMREKLSKTEYMKDLEQKTKDCWDGNYQFQEDRSATYRDAPKHAAAKARRIMFAATRGGKDVATKIPVLDVRLRMLSASPKMEWSRRKVPNEQLSPRSMASGGSNGMSSNLSLQQSSSKRDAPIAIIPPPHMKAITKFNNNTDMRNPKYLYNMLHGATKSRKATMRASRSLPNM